MNSILKNVLVVVVIVLLVGFILKVAGFNMFGPNEAVNTTANTEQSSSTNASNGASNSTNTANSGGSKSTGTSGASTASTAPLSNDALMALINNASIIRVPNTGVDVSLYQGGSNFVDGAVSGHVSIDHILGKVPTDSGYDVFVDMTITTAGKTSIIHYVALFRNLGQAVVFTSAAPVGDRLILQNVTALLDKNVITKKPVSYMTSSVGYTLNLSYLDRKNGESYAMTPTLPKTMSFSVKNHIVSK